MAKTPLEPAVVGQLKKLFIENHDGKNILLKSGKVKLANGKREVNLPISFERFTVLLQATGTSAGAYYVADTTEKYKFTIVSSSSSDTAEVFWVALGG